MSSSARTTTGEAYKRNTAFPETGGLKNCMPCGKWRPLAGGRLNKRSRLWTCSNCVAMGRAK